MVHPKLSTTYIDEVPMNFLVFAIERSIVFTTVGLLTALVIKLFFGKFLNRRVPVTWRRAVIYAAISALGIIFDYSNVAEKEFSNLPAYMFVVIFVTSFLWSFILIFPVAHISSKFSRSKTK